MPDGEEHFGIPVNEVWRQAGNIPYEPTPAQERADRKRRGEQYKAEQAMKDPFKIKAGGGWGDPPGKIEPRAMPGGAPITAGGKRSRSPAKPRSRAGRGKPACKYGPRGADGFCPKKPSTSRGKSLSYSAPRPLPKRQSRLAGRVGSATAGVLVSSAFRAAKNPTVRQGVKTLLTKLPVGKVVASGAAGASTTAGIVLAAGLLSYYVTTRILEARKARRMKRAEEAALAADGYVLARREAEARLKRPLNAYEQRILADKFKQQLAALGLSTTTMNKL